MFLTAAEAAWRRASSPNYQGGGVVVAIGYPLTNTVFSPRRIYDLTPPGGSSSESGRHGGAEHLLDFIEGTVKPFVATHFLAGSTVGREAIFGHSLGGLFGLYALLTRTSLFDCYMCASPSIWFHDCLILDFERRFYEDGRADKPAGMPRPALMMSVGSLEQNISRRSGETEEEFEKRRNMAKQRAMLDNAEMLCARLKQSDLLSGVVLREYPGEDHGTVMACALSRFLTTFFEEWPVNS